MLLYLPSGQAVTPPRDPATWVERATGVDGDPLRMRALEQDVSGSVAFHRQKPMFQGIGDVAIAVATATYTPIPLTEIVDNVAGHNDSANTSRWYAPSTINTTDWYLALGVIPYAGTDPTKSYITGYRIDGSAIIEGSKLPGTTGHTHTGLICDLVQMTSDGTHYAELLGRHDAGVSVNTVVSGKSPALSMRWVCSGSGTVVALPSAPRTWTAADLLTADTTGAGKVPLNLHIRDTIRWLNFPPIARITSVGTAQTIPTGTGTWTSIQFPTMTVDNYGMWSSGTNTKPTCQRAGLYFVHGLASVVEVVGAAGYRAARILHTIAAGGTAIYGGASTPPATNSSSGTQIPASALIRMAVGDTLELQMQQSDVGALAVRPSTGHARLIAVWRSL